MKTIIIGAGLTGLYFQSLFKKDKPIILESSSKVGGLCKTIREYPYMWDYSGHFIHSNIDLFSKLCDIRPFYRKSKIFIKKLDKLIDYPFQVNTHQLSKTDKEYCRRTLKNRKIKIVNKNFEDWCLSNYGKGIYNLFMKPYNEKLYKTLCKNMSLDFTKYIPNISYDDLKKGTYKKLNKNYGYNSKLYYPVRGGIGSICNKFSNSQIKTNEKVIKINPTKKYITTTKRKYKYNKLVSTMPLPELCKLLGIKHKLKWVSLKIFMVGSKKRLSSNAHWIYYPDKYDFHRLCLFSNVPGMSVYKYYSICAEVSYKNKCKVSFDEIEKQLLDSKIISQIDYKIEKDVPYGYVIFDKKYDSERARIFKQLEKYNISSIGRFGEWKYSTMSNALNDAIFEKIREDE